MGQKHILGARAGAGQPRQQVAGVSKNTTNGYTGTIALKKKVKKMKVMMKIWRTTLGMDLTLTILPLFRSGFVIQKKYGANCEMDQRISILLDAVSYVAREIAKVESVEKIVIFGSLAKNAKKWMELEGIATTNLAEAGEYWLFDDPILLEAIHRDQQKRPRKSPFKLIKDVDLAIWISSTDELSLIRKALGTALKKYISCGKFGVSNNEFDIFLLDAGTNKYLGNLCRYATCPKEKDECNVRGCGKVPHLQKFKEFVLFPSAVNEVNRIDVYDKLGSSRIEAEFDLSVLLQEEEKDDLEKLIVSIYNKSDAMKRHILQWFAKMEKIHGRAGEEDSES